MAVVAEEVRAAVAGYASRLHRAVGDSHHVASPLGAWLLLALCGPASGGADRAELEEALGCEVGLAARVAAELLGEPHPLVAAAAGVWRRGGVDREALSAWLAGLPPQVETGMLTDQASLDEWARRHTFDLIREFPVDLSEEVLLVLATALAAKVSWQVSFEVAPAAAFGPDSPWASRLNRVLRTPGDWGHAQFVAATHDAGDVAVHTAWADGGLLVTSVAAAPGVPAADVLAAAHRLAAAAATGGRVTRRSLFDLPAGAGPLWEITERAAAVSAPDGREERCSAVLPAWSAGSSHNLADDPSLGFRAGAAVLAGLLGWGEFVYEAKQAAFARYSRTGFEAAAVTFAGMGAGTPATRPGCLRTAELRFGRPFAVVAVIAEDRLRGGATGGNSAWHGLPMFSAWITEPEDAEEPADPAEPQAL